MLFRVARQRSARQAASEQLLQFHAGSCYDVTGDYELIHATNYYIYDRIKNYTAKLWNSKE
jgi:hypothetical protein